jgi:FtsP/CotA-like multicopper oxidase with cupredoxin domain
MNRHILHRLLYVVLALAIAPWGLNQALAGPGGGTYYANSPAGGASGLALRKFVDSLPGVGPTNANNLGQYIPIAQKITPPAGVPNDGDYYEIGVVQYSEKMHSDLPKKTLLRGYKDLNPAFANISAHYLGPLIIAQRDRPVRVKLRNLLPTGAAGDLFIPTDTTLMGAGMGPYTAGGAACDPTAPGAICANYTQNRATFHLHGGNTPWFSDGTPHQWTAPVGETSVPPAMRKGVSTYNVPDMPNPGKPGVDGEMTFFWSNQQSNRLMFYHDHSLGITRLNVYAGEAAGYLLVDPTEEGLITNGTLPNAGGVYRYGIPLVIQDKTFVPQNVAVQDAKWTNPKWGTYGDLWFPHVYEPNQDPNSPAGANPFGRWDYGPWFWPPVNIDASRSTIPEPSTTPEGFHDTPLVNGTAYPYLVVEPKPYRFRILNACNDRGLNLSLFYSDPSDPANTEVKMVPAGPNPSFPSGPFPDVAVWPTDGRDGGVPDPATMGPKLIQIGSEGGFLPKPVIHANQPINYNYNRRDIVVLNMQEKNLFLGPAERADVIVDFSTVPPGKNIILYNDGPAPTPAFDTRYDYYTGNPDQTAGGGAPSTLRGYGPNTRTIMQFRVQGTAGAPFDLATLQTALPIAFAASQPAPLIPEPTYPVASNGNATSEQYSKIQDYSFTLPMNTLANPAPAAKLTTTIPFRSKAIQELWDPYGRMNATLGIELPFTNNLTQTTIPMGYAEPTTENIIDGQPQIWKITHNGVDTHPVHFHMVNVQVVNRVGWDGAIRPPDDNELGWKETVRMNPLEDIIVALLPKSTNLPAAMLPIPVSSRPIDPTLPADKTLAATDIGNLSSTIFSTTPANVGSPTNAAAVTVRNTPAATTGDNIQNVGYDYGQEFVWHCHILGHEENDFMRPMVFRTSNAAQPAFTITGAFIGGGTVPGATNYVSAYTNIFANKIVLQWNDGAPVTTPSSFLIQRNGVDYATISFLSGFPPIFTDTQIDSGATYNYLVFAFNAAAGANCAAPGSIVGSACVTPATNNPVTVTAPNWTDPTSVTLAADKPSPHVEGTNVVFTAAAAGATITSAPVGTTTVAYLYEFSLQAGAATPVVVQSYSNQAFWTMPDTTPVGSYTIIVKAKTSDTASGASVVTANIPYLVVFSPQPPVTTASPVPGAYSTSPLMVTLSAQTQSPPATIFYTLDGSTPTTASTQYIGPISLTAPSTTINYFAVDVNNVAETPKTGVWNIHTSGLIATLQINNGAAVTNSRNVTLNLIAFDPVAGVDTMQFSNDNVLYTAEEPYATTKAWQLSDGDGFKTVYVRFRDKALPIGNLYPPVTASITLATIAPVTTASPVAGTYGSPITVRLLATSPSNIYYTTDGSNPSIFSTKYIGPITVNVTTTVKFFAVDLAGNTEQTKTAVYTINSTYPLGSLKINNGATSTSNQTVTLSFSASNVISMQLSNDGTSYNTEEPYVASKSWLLTAGEGVKNVYAKFRDATTNNQAAPVSATITLGIKDGLIPGTTSYLASAMFALQFANGLAIPDDLDLAHADVAPYRNGASQPDGKIDGADVHVILLRQVGLITSF